MFKELAHAVIFVQINRYINYLFCCCKDFLSITWWEGDNYSPIFSFQFQQHKYSSLTWFKCGKKGYGLKAVEDISKGKFLIEYVGEVSWTMPSMSFCISPYSIDSLVMTNKIYSEAELRNFGTVVMVLWYIFSFYG